jgi:hypothetical protein
MSRSFVLLGTAASELGNASPAPVPVDRPSSGEYFELIRQLFHDRAAVAIVGSNNGGSAVSVSSIAEDLAAELGAFGKRVVVVSVNRLLRMNPVTIPDELAFMPGNSPQVWVWPAPAGQKIEFFKSRQDGRGNWLDSLRLNFDSVVLDCPDLEGSPGVTEVAAMADAAVLAVRAGLASKQQIHEDQRALQLRGARIAGCILIQR